MSIGQELAALDATGQAELVRDGQVTALELVDAARSSGSSAPARSSTRSSTHASSGPGTKRRVTFPTARSAASRSC
jgi:hypothetical protein